MKKITLLVFSFCFIQFVYSQPNSWTHKMSLPSASRVAGSGFALNQHGYVCMGNDSNGNMLSDNWQYNPSNNTWLQKSNLPFASRVGGTAFTVGAKSYTAFGFLMSGNGANDLWEYDDVTDSWTQKSNCPGSGRALTNSFVIGNKAYITCGVIDDFNDVTLRDCWEYDFQTNAWTAKANLPGTSRVWPVSFVVDGLAYVGTGLDSTDNSLSDFYCYNNQTDSWSQISDVPVPRIGATGFTLYNTGYIGLGDDGNNELNDLWYYQKPTNTWHQVASLPAAPRDACYIFVINNKAYVGGGEDVNTDCMRDLWEYTPDTILTKINEVSETLHSVNVSLTNNNIRIELSLISLPAHLNVYSINGSKVFNSTVTGDFSNYQVNEMKTGKYFYSVSDANGKIYSGSVNNLVE